jgi:TetR/AcrR family fatty acid metabolism transcriptional regulator
MTAHSPSAARGLGDKRERILDAAELIFARHGFYNAKVAEIARQAGVADGTIYLYFKSKDDLLISLFESRMERLIASLTTAIAGVTGAAAKLRALFAAYVGLIGKNPELGEVLTVELRQSAKFMKEYSNPRFAEFLKLLAGVIADGQATGELADGVPAPIAARAIFGMLDEIALAWLITRGEKFDIVQAADWLGVLALEGLQRRKT